MMRGVERPGIVLTRLSLSAGLRLVHVGFFLPTWFILHNYAALQVSLALYEFILYHFSHFCKSFMPLTIYL